MADPKFVVVVTCQGNPKYYGYGNLLSALIGYAKHYLTKKKYGTMTFKLRQVLITDDIAKL